MKKPTYKWDILGLQPTDPNLLLTSWDIQVHLFALSRRMEGIEICGRITSILNSVCHPKVIVFASN